MGEISYRSPSTAHFIIYRKIKSFMLKPIIFLYKPRCLTPLQAIEKFREQNSLYRNAVISYAGRLDPMAEGLLILLIGKENKRRQAYERLSKSYRYELLLGVATDTYDCLGIIKREWKKPFPSDINETLRRNIGLLTGEHLQPYPPFSSHPVLGKPLFWWARRGLIHTIQAPQKKISITASSYLKLTHPLMKNLENDIIRDVSHVSGDFRQEEILASWKNFFDTSAHVSLPMVSGTITCTSGTYIRSVIHTLGESLKTGAIAIRIIRTRIGEVSLQTPHLVRIL